MYICFRQYQLSIDIKTAPRPIPIMAPHVTKSDVVSQEVTVTHGVVKAIVVARIVIVFLILYIIVLPVIFHRPIGFELITCYYRSSAEECT